jgi:hypothetical protein
MGNSFSGDTGLSPLSGGNPTPICGFETSCINGCRSDFYRVSAGLGVIEFQTCAEAAETSFNPRMYLWEGSSSDCSTFSCASGTCIAKRGARVSSTRKGGNPSRGIFASSLFRSLPLLSARTRRAQGQLPPRISRRGPTTRGGGRDRVHPPSHGGYCCRVWTVQLRDQSSGTDGTDRLHEDRQYVYGADG